MGKRVCFPIGPYLQKLQKSVHALAGLGADFKEGGSAGQSQQLLSLLDPEVFSVCTIPR